VFWAALVVGMLLAIGGFASLNQALVGTTTGQLILCSGLGIIFGAFGSTATVKYKGIVITGVAAVAISLLLVVDFLIEDNYIELEILGDINGAEVEVVGDVNYLGAPRERAHRFIIIARKIRKKYLTVVISIPPNRSVASGAEFIFECIPKGEIEPYLGSGEILQWRFDRTGGRILDGERVIASVGPCQREANIGPEFEERIQNFFVTLGSMLSARALAVEPAEILTLMDELESGSAYVRRQARGSLAKQGLSVVQPMLTRLAAEPGRYRTRLGIIVALTEMLRDNKDRRKEVSSLLTSSDLKRLVDASADRDRTIRIYASEFLYDLGDPRVVPLLFERFETADDNGKYNLLVALSGTYPYLDDALQAGTNQKLLAIREGVGEKTSGLIDRIVVDEGPSTEPKYWVIVGSYTDRSAAQAHADRINEEDSSAKAFVGKRKPANPYYPVIVGNYVPREQADRVMEAVFRLKSVREYGSAPYLSAYPDRRP